MDKRNWRLALCGAIAIACAWGAVAPSVHAEPPASGAGAKPPAKPGARPGAKPAVPDRAAIQSAVDKLNAEALLALHLGDAVAASELAGEAVRLVKSPGAGVSRPSAVQAHSLLATSHLSRGRWTLADRSLTDALAANGADAPGRELALNRALCEARFGRFLSAAQVVRKELEARNTVSAEDEQLLVILGSILTADATDRSISNPRTFDELVQVYERRLAALEQTRPGERMWGAIWLDADEVARRREERKRMLDLAAEIGAKVDDAEARLNKALRQLKENKRAANLGQAATFPRAENDRANAEYELSKLRPRHAAALEGIPTPLFPEDYAIALPPLPGESVSKPLYDVPESRRVRDPLAAARAARRPAAGDDDAGPGAAGGNQNGRGPTNRPAGGGGAASGGAGGSLFPTPVDEPANDAPDPISPPAGSGAAGAAPCEPAARADVRQDARTFTRRGIAVALDDRHLLTVYSVVDSGTRFTLTADAAGTPVTAAVVMVQPSTNLALLRAETPLPASVAFASSDLRPGAAGVLTVAGASLFAQEVKRLPATIKAGTAGAPPIVTLASGPRLRGAAVVDRAGALLTLLTATEGTPDAAAFAYVDPGSLREFLQECLPGGTQKRGDVTQATFELSVDVPEP